MDMEGFLQSQEVWGNSDASRAAMGRLLPKFKYDGGNPGKFDRDFPLVAAHYGIQDVLNWDPDTAITKEDDVKLNNVAMAVLRQYLSDEVLQVVLVDRPTNASAVFSNLKIMFLGHDNRTKVQNQQLLSACEQGRNESLVTFLSRINSLLEESTRLGDTISPQARLCTVAARLRQPWRAMAQEKLDREPELDYAKLVQFLMQKRLPENLLGTVSLGGKIHSPQKR